VPAPARSCGRASPFELEPTPRGVPVVTPSTRRHGTWIAELATCRARVSGVVDAQAVASAARDGGVDVSDDDLHEAIVRHAGGEFLAGDWFWLPGVRQNRLAGSTCRILAVASPLDVATIRAGLCRTVRRRHATAVPPAGALAEFYAAHPAFAIDARGDVRPERPLDCERALTRSDRIFVDVLRSSWTGVLDRASFREACVARGMTRATFHVQVVYSAVLDHPARDVWCLRGTRVSGITAAALRHARTRGTPMRATAATFPFAS
jgi:hypothetical protein